MWLRSERNVQNEKQIIDALAEAIEFGPLVAMRCHELLKGGRLIRTGSVDWLPSCDWVDDMLVSQIGEEVRLIAIEAKAPGTGAFSRLIASVGRAGLRPVVLCPFSEMEEILVRWRWRQ